jgi:hypothetical protein
MATEQGSGSPVLATTREPVGPSVAGDKGTNGDRAVMDSVIMVLVAWGILFALMYSLRAHNI